MSLTKKVDAWIQENLFNAVPIAIAVMDKDFNVVMANLAFEQMFGEWHSRKCYSVYKDSDTVCSDCKAAEALKSGQTIISEEVGYNKDGRVTRHIKQTVPIIEDGGVNFLVEMSIDVTTTEKLKEQRKLLFEQVPCNILVIDKDFRIVRTNKKVKDRFGLIKGTHCYKSLKGLDSICSGCNAKRTFEEGRAHTGFSQVTDKDGNIVHLQVTTIPLEDEDNDSEHVMEMAVDISQTINLEEELQNIHSFMESMIATSLDGIIAVNDKNEIILFNQAARNIFNVMGSKNVSIEELEWMLPDGFLAQIGAGPGQVYLPETEISTIDSQSVPVRLSGIQLNIRGKHMGMALSIQNLKEVKQLEKEKLEAERLAAVGQTVAGLAHGVKNLITGLDGGMYMLTSGISKGNAGRVTDGMEMLNRNIGRISVFVKEFLNFSKGREISVEINNPLKIAEEVVALYYEKARKIGIELKVISDGKIKDAPMDYEGMHECITNLVGNAIDACQMSDEERCQVLVRVFERDEAIIYEVIDEGCGMDYEVKKKVFTSFFTTKGLGGTGIGLLTTKKIIQEHGGKIDVESSPEKGTTFRIILPRKRLPKNK